MFKKELFSHAKHTLKNCETLAEFGSRTVMQDQLGKKVSPQQIAKYKKG